MTHSTAFHDRRSIASHRRQPPIECYKFIVDRNGDPVARISPVAGVSTGTARELVEVWRSVGAPEASFADDLEAVGALDLPPELPWAS